MMKIWIGHWLVVVALIHTLFMFVVFLDPLQEIIKQGVFDSIGNEPLLGAVAWFGLFGGLLFVLGLAVTALERSPQGIPTSLGWSILALTLLGILLMPASGFWLALPAGIGILWKR